MPNNIGDYLQAEFLITSAEFMSAVENGQHERIYPVSQCHIQISRWPCRLDSETPSLLEDHSASSPTTNSRISPRGDHEMTHACRR
jgi:hypothetical protein